MCGIVAIFGYRNSAPPADRDELLRMRDHMVARGPDGCGAWLSADNRVGLAHRRLAIIDLSESGSQPMCSDDGNLVITFNGEIYNYRELRKGLEAKGVRFRSTSDTEVLLRMYAVKGSDMVHDLRGMYAFAIWDGRKKGLFLARDPFGIKPLYYADDGRTFRAASQVKALLSGGAVGTAPEPAGHAGFFLWGHVPEPYTLYRSIRSLPAGSSLWINEHGVRAPEQFCSISQELANAPAAPLAMSREEMQEQLRNALVESVRYHLVADVPVAVFLSSGLDSSTLAALSGEAGGDLNTVTLGFDEFRGTVLDETPLAELTAKQYGAKHRTIWVKREDFIAEYGRLMHAMDQPSIDGVNAYFVSLAAAKAGMKVAISGLGGDELFGGYPGFYQIPRMVKAFKPLGGLPFLGKSFRIFASPFLKNLVSPKYAGLLEYGGSWGGAYLLRRGMYMPWELCNVLDKGMAEEGWRELQTVTRLQQTIRGIHDDYLKVSALELNWYMRNQLLRDVDWASMAHSIEVRVPLLDLKLLRTLVPLLRSTVRPDKRTIASSPSKALPGQVLSRGKTGFFIPMREWLSDQKPIRGSRGLRGWAKQVYSPFRHVPSLLKNNEKKKRTILIYRIGQLGDTLISLPAIQKIRATYPDHSLVLLADRHNDKFFVSSWDVLRPTGWIEDVVFYTPGEKISDKLRNTVRLMSRLRSIHPEYTFNLAPDRTVPQRARDKFFFKVLIGTTQYTFVKSTSYKIQKRADGTLPHVEPEWKQLMRVVGLDASAPPFHLTIPAQERKLAHTVLPFERLGAARKLVAFAPGSKMPSKIWPQERYAELGKLLLQEAAGIEIVVLGGKEDRIIGEELCRTWGRRCHNVAGQLSIYGSAAVLEECLLYVGNDTGTMHLAAMVGIPCVAIFSARDYPGKWEPYGEGHSVLRHETECAGCLLELCPFQNKCLDLITIDQVLASVRGILKKPVRK